MTTPTTAPIAGNQYYTNVVDAAPQLPLLNVSELEVSNAILVDANIQNGHLLTSADNPPTLDLLASSFGSLTFAGFATDVAGQLRFVGASAANDTVRVVYHRPYPTAIQNIQLTGTNLEAAGSRAFISATATTHFDIEFPAITTNPSFNYFVVDAVAV